MPGQHPFVVRSLVGVQDTFCSKAIYHRLHRGKERLCLFRIVSGTELSDHGADLAPMVPVAQPAFGILANALGC